MKSITSKTIVFITGAFVHNSCWDEWKSFFESRGYTTIAPPWLFKNATPASLTQTEIEEIEIILKQCIAAYNPGRQLQFDTISKAHPEYNIKVDNFVINLPRYKRQYIAVINSAGQKEVWVNCFCQHFDTNWRTEILMVEDGGNCYFNLTINLATKTYSKLSVNGEA